MTSAKSPSTPFSRPHPINTPVQPDSAVDTAREATPLLLNSIQAEPALQQGPRAPQLLLHSLPDLGGRVHSLGRGKHSASPVGNRLQSLLA